MSVSLKAFPLTHQSTTHGNGINVSQHDRLVLLSHYLKARWQFHPLVSFSNLRTHRFAEFDNQSVLDAVENALATLLPGQNTRSR